MKSFKFVARCSWEGDYWWVARDDSQGDISVCDCGTAADAGKYAKLIAKLLNEDKQRRLGGKR